MNMTDQDISRIVDELESRLKAKSQGYSSGHRTMFNMERAKDHFWNRCDDMKKSRTFEIVIRKGLKGSDWDMIRRLVCHAQGVSLVREIPDDKIDAVNDLAIKIVDILFDYNETVLQKEDPFE